MLTQIYKNLLTNFIAHKIPGDTSEIPRLFQVFQVGRHHGRSCNVTNIPTCTGDGSYSGETVDQVSCCVAAEVEHPVERKHVVADPAG